MNLSRRQWLATAVAGGVSLTLPAAFAEKRRRIRWAQGWLLWRDVPGQTLKQAIDDLHAVGADGIEYSPRDGEPEKWGFSRESLLAYLGERGMAVSGMYFPVASADPARKDEIVASARKRIARLKELASRNLIIGPPDTPEGADRLDAIKRLGPTLDEIGRVAREEGVEAGLHPHLNTLIESPAEIDAAMASTDGKLVRLSADTGHIHLGGGDVLAILRRYGARLNYFHFKDGVRPVARPRFEPSLRELGQGEIDFVAVMKLLARLRYTGWINVELDKSVNPPRKAAEISFEYVKRKLWAVYT